MEKIDRVRKANLTDELYDLRDKFDWGKLPPIQKEYD